MTSNCRRRSFLAGIAGVAALPAVTVSAAAKEWSLPRGDPANTGHAGVAGATKNLRGHRIYNADTDISAIPLVRMGTCYVGTEAGTVVAQPIDGGRPQWTVEVGDTPILAITPHRDQVLVPTRSGQIRSLDRATGEGRWQQQVGQSLGTPITATESIAACGTTEGTVAVLDPADGSVRWTASFPDRLRGSPAILSNTVLARDENGVVAAFEQATGEQRWRRDLSMGHVGPPVVRDGRVYVAGAVSDGPEGTDGRVLALDVETGQTIWQRAILGPVLDGLAAGPSSLFVTDTGYVYALDPADGTERWRTGVGERTFLASVTDTLYVRSADALVAYDPADGSEQTRFAPGGPLDRHVPMVGPERALTGGPVPIAGGALVTDDDGGVWAVRDGDSVRATDVAGGAGLVGLCAYALHRYRQ